MSGELFQIRPIFPDPRSSGNWTPARVGCKADALFRLPADWVPAYFVLPSDCLSGEIDFPTLDKALHSLGGDNRVIVRSSATVETLADRGRYLSLACEKQLSKVVRTITEIIEHARRQAADATEASGMALIIQRFIPPRLSGHLSNERRVSRAATRWRLEIEDGDSSRVMRLETKRHKQSKVENRILSCKQRDDLERCLASVAQYLLNQNGRVHVEWVWDGDRLWIVQVDIEETTEGIEPGLHWKGKQPKRIEAAKLQVLTLASRVQREWPKARAVSVFESCGLPTWDVYFIENAEEIDRLARGNASEALLLDLKELLESPILIRTDAIPAASPTGMLLPRTDAIFTQESAVAFLVETARAFIGKGLLSTEFAFAMHRFVPAVGAAYALARPSIPRVLIDSTWGGPDGLLYYAHDSFQVDMRNHRVTSRKIRCKSFYLDMDDQGNWSEIKSGSKWDWAISLTDNEIVEIAHATQRIANSTGKAVEVMFFVGVDLEGRRVCLPWFYTGKIPERAAEGTNFRYIGNRHFIRSMSDLERLANSASESAEGRRVVLRLAPVPKLLRSEEFVQETARIARQLDATVELEGSILAHCYYMLLREGAHVVCVAPLRESLKRRRYNKLVRDKIPGRIETVGESTRSVSVDGKELLGLLKTKAVEEAFELYWEHNTDAIIEELADIIEVVDAACRECGVSVEQLQAVRAKKQSERGGFQKGILLLETSDLPLIEGNEYRRTHRPETRMEAPQVGSSQTRQSPVLVGDLLVLPISADKRERTFVLRNGRSVVKVECDLNRITVSVSRDVISGDGIRQQFFPLFTNERET